MSTIQPYYIVPLLIEQPTWGGQYITTAKSITENEVVSKKIGQAYELAQESLLTPTFDQPSYLYATATSINQSTQFGSAETLSLASLIETDPVKVLGENVVNLYGPKMPLLIKFTQALSNSYQVHVKKGQEFNQWLPKPESWYFFEQGKATLGLAADCDVEAYKKRCHEIHDFATEVSKQVQSGKINLATATEQLTEYISDSHPSEFVNTIFPNADVVIDLSQGGIHHSWETDLSLSNGNILYEVQHDVKDEFCTMRSFDQGKLKDDGSIRDLTIDDYFAALDTDPVANDPTSFLKPVEQTTDQTAQVKKLFTTPYYTLTSLTLTGTYSGQETNTEKSGFHHLFVKKGAVTIEANNQRFPLKTGWSLFIPANTNQYSLVTDSTAEVLKTTI